MEGPTPFFYIPFRQWFAPGLNFSVFLKTAGDPLRMTPVLRREALALNQDAVFSTRSLSDATTGSLFAQHVAASLLGVVGGISLLLAAIGLYSVMSYAVSQRTQEMGIRMALGAQPGDVLGLVLREGLRLTCPGCVAGSIIALAAARIVGGMLVNVSAADPLTFASAAAFLGLVAALAATCRRCGPRAWIPSSHCAASSGRARPCRTGAVTTEFGEQAPMQLKQAPRASRPIGSRASPSRPTDAVVPLR